MHQHFIANYKQLLGCPKCEANGRRYILGELAPTGHILIQRVHGNNGQYRNFTIIGGNDFYLICDRCGETIYFKKVERRSNDTDIRNEWFFRQTLSESFAGSRTDPEGAIASTGTA